MHGPLGHTPLSEFVLSKMSVVVVNRVEVGVHFEYSVITASEVGGEKRPISNWPFPTFVHGIVESFSGEPFKSLLEQHDRDAACGGGGFYPWFAE